MRNALFVLKRVEVRGEYAKVYGDAIEALEKGVKALDEARKEADKHADQNK